MYYTIIILYLPRVSIKHKLFFFVAGVKISNIDDEKVDKEEKNANMLVVNEKTEKKEVNKSKYPRNERVRVSSMILNQDESILYIN